MAEEELKVESLDDVLSSEETTAEVVEESTDVKKEPEKAEDSPSEPESKEAKLVPIQGMLDERDKRQQLERDLEESNARVAELTKEPEKERPDVFEDQEGAFQHIEQRLDNSRVQDRFALSRDFMSMLKDDYDDKEKVFMELAKDTPSLREDLLASPNPARFAYDTAVKHEQLKDMDNIDDYRDKLKAELREELKAEFEAETDENAQKEAGKREALTPSLATKRSTSGLETVTEDSLDDVLSNMK